MAAETLSTGDGPQETFVREVADLARQLLGARVERLGDLGLRVQAPGAEAVTINLDNLYIETQAVSADERRFRLHAMLGAFGVIDRPASWDDAADRVLPAVRATSWAVGAGAGVSRRQMLPFVELLFAIDSDTTIAYVTEADLRMWGVDQGVVEGQALANLAGYDPAIEPLGAAAVVTGPDGYASSWLASPGELSRFADLLGPELIVLAPARDQLRLIDAGDTEAVVSGLKRSLDDYDAEPRRLSPVPYALSRGAVTVWDPPASHPAVGLVALARRTLATFEYGCQQEALAELLQHAGADLAVAAHTLMSASDGTPWSWALWPAGKPTLLPEVDRLIVGDGDGVFSVAWADALAAAGLELRVEPGLSPARWRTAGPPSLAALARLRARGTVLGPADI
jgi:hypothetical protein